MQISSNVTDRRCRNVRRSTLNTPIAVALGDHTPSGAESDLHVKFGAHWCDLDMADGDWLMVSAQLQHSENVYHPPTKKDTGPPLSHAQ